ncbi:hypothetical protein VUR80DRAFT_6419 [Thermomyces stellatus]
MVSGLSDKPINGFYTIIPDIEVKKPGDIALERVNEADKKALPWMMPRSEPITKNFGEIKVFAGLHAYLGMFDKGVTSASLCVEKEDEKKKEIAGVWVMGGEKGIETTASNVASSIPRLDGSVHRVKCRQYANMLILQDYVKNWGTLELSKNRLGTYLERLGVIRRLGFRKTGNSGPRGIFEPLQSESMIGVVPQAWTPELPCRGNGDRYELWNPEKIVEGLKGRRFKETSAIILAHLLAKRCLKPHAFPTPRDFVKEELRTGTPQYN